MAVLSKQGLEFYHNKLMQFLMQNYSTDVKSTIAINTAKEAKALIVQENASSVVSENSENNENSENTPTENEGE